MMPSLFPRANFMRWFHFTIALAATLTGCTCVAPQQGSQMGSKTIAKSEKAIAVKKENLRHRRNASTHTKIAESTITAKMQTPLQPDDKNAELKKSIAAKTEIPQSSQLDDESAIKKAKVAIAAKMENPASVVFLEMKRAARKDALGNSIDTICGRVRGKPETQETGRSCMSFKKTRRTSAVTL